MKAILLLALLFVAPSLFAQSQMDELTVTWARTNFPPGFILKGEFKGMGYGDRLNNFMIESLKGYNHKSVVYPNFARLLNDIHNKKHKVICTSTLFYRYPEDRKTLAGKQLLSAPNFVFFLHDLIVKKSKRHLYDDVVSLKNILENQELKLGYSRTTGPKSSRIIGNYIGVNKDISSMDVKERIRALQKKKNIHVRLSTDMVGGPLKMLLKERIDYILEYEFMVDFEAERLGIKDQFVSIPVEETLDDISLGAFGCSDTAEGKKVIEEINQVLINKRKSEEYRELLNFLLPKDPKRVERYWKEHQKILKIEE